MLLAFDMPWYAWPTTGATIMALFAILGVYLAYRYNCRLKSLEALGASRIALEEVINLISLATMPCDRFAGQRFISAGGWDALASKRCMLEAKIDVLRIYGGLALEKHADVFSESVRQFCRKVYLSIICCTHESDNMTIEAKQEQKQACHYLASILDGKIKPYDEFRQQLLSLKRFIRK